MYNGKPGDRGILRCHDAGQAVSTHHSKTKTKTKQKTGTQAHCSNRSLIPSRNSGLSEVTPIGNILAICTLHEFISEHKCRKKGETLTPHRLLHEDKNC